MKVDILVLAAHPDDAEMSCGGTLARQIALGQSVAIVDLTRGELGTRGTPQIREAEARRASEIIGITTRENLEFADGFFENDRQHQLRVVEAIRRYRPQILIANAIEDRHPDHGKGAALAQTAHFIAGLRQVVTHDAHTGQPQQAWRPPYLYHYIQDRYIRPDFVVDVSDFWQQKVESIRAFRSQFYNPESDEPESYISSPAFFEFLMARGREMGHRIGVEFGEGFTSLRQIGVSDLRSLC